VNEPDDVTGGSPRSGVAGFDPVRAFTDAHRRAIDTADSSFRLFARFFGTDATSRGNGHHDHGGQRRVDGLDGDEAALEEEPVGFAELRRSVIRSLDLYLEMAERMFDSSTRSLEGALRARGVTVTGTGKDPTWTPLRPSGRAGAHASTPIWLHNSTDETLGDVCFRPTDLVAHTGSIVRAAAVRVTPPGFEQVAPGASLCGELTIDLPADLAPGSYAGYVLLSPVPDAVLPILLDVLDAQVDDGP
jgi:hypothetical protein